MTQDGAIPCAIDRQRKSAEKQRLVLLKIRKQISPYTTTSTCVEKTKEKEEKPKPNQSPSSKTDPTTFTEVCSAARRMPPQFNGIDDCTNKPRAKQTRRFVLSQLVALVSNGIIRTCPSTPRSMTNLYVSPYLFF
jgi:hypothetical protein